ncbi:glycosyltransferase family 4 protein [Salinibacter ruber]|uniref:glycosyltransferase family 4 protein n=1 Tax=Salinibacter ruber TaxID=146919 RepID=UPI002166D512|nr:glycosyltransferase family 4 protein [Salinibacter ruber]MCS4174823.1 glycosyltransferase involved in cell wall biosynthesis [Salinibacter ruber]
MNVLIAHPGRQHAHQLALALHQENALYGFWTGVPTADPKTKGPLYQVIAHLSPQPTTSLLGEKVRHNYVVPLARRINEQLWPERRGKAYQHRVLWWFDRWCARRFPQDINAVICYESSARDTFCTAKKQGVATILDAASFHHEWQDEVYEPLESDTAHRRINARKDEEVELADHILTVSELARESYVEAGVSPEKVTSVPMGADLSAFGPEGPGGEDDSGPFTFLFAGQAGRRKGVDVLLEASERLAGRSEKDHRVQFAGSTDDDLFDRTDAPVEKLGYLSRPALAAAFRRANCLVLPSRHDSFGRVVVEAMATGLPVIVSEHVGAKEVLTEGETGWVVPVEDSVSLAAQMKWCVEHPEQVADMQSAIVDAVQNYTWDAYGERVIDVLASAVKAQSGKKTLAS